MVDGRPRDARRRWRRGGTTATTAPAPDESGCSDTGDDPCQPRTSAEVSDDVVAPGEPVTVSTPPAFAPGSPVTINLVRADDGAGPVLSESATASSTGAVSDSITVPNVPDGVYFVYVVGTDADGNRVVALTPIVVRNGRIDELGYSTSHVNIARGDDFPDALSGSGNAGTEKALILLTQTPDSLGPAAALWLQQHSSTLTTMHVYGGQAAVSDSTVNAAEVAAGRTP